MQARLTSNLSKQAVDQINDSPDTALDAYGRLQSFIAALRPLQVDAEEAAPHLLDYFESKAAQVRESLLQSLSENLETILKKILWPKPGVKIPDTVQEELHDASTKLLTLQKPELLNHNQSSNTANATITRQSTVLLPLQVMVKPLETRFRFHFSGSKTTNRLDKPEYFLSHAQDLLSTYAPLMNDHLQPVLLRAFQGTELVYNANYIDATSAFITALMPMLREKVFSLVAQVSGDPRLLSHLLHELMNFDEILHDEWRYGMDTASATTAWKGLTWEVLAQPKWFDRWLQVEKDFALARYQTIIDDPDSNTLDYDSLESNATKPAKAAIRVNDLLETITDRYRRLASFNQKLRFLVDIQISIFDSYHHRLHESLEKYRLRTGATADELKGLKGLDHLCRIFGSASYLGKAMRDWSDDVFFVELWNELQYRAKSRPQDSTVAGNMTMSDIASRTSNTLDNEDTSTGALFDETAAAYAGVRTRTEDFMLNTLSTTFRDAMHPYARDNPWSSRAVPASGSSTDTESPTTTSINLNPFFDVLHSHLGFLAKALGTLPLRRMGRHIAHNLDAYVLDKVLMGNTFDRRAALQVKVDVEVVAHTVDQHIGGGTGSKGMRRCLEAANTLALKEDVATGADELDLRTVQQRLYADSDAGREVLEQLGIERLTLAEARKVLARRVELDD